jgi:hypothetical protein
VQAQAQALALALALVLTQASEQPAKWVKSG